MAADFASEYKNTLAMTLKGLWSPDAKIGAEGKLPDNRQFKTWAEELIEDRKMTIDGMDIPIAMLQGQIKDDANASRLLRSQFGTDDLEKIILTEKQVKAADSAFSQAEDKSTNFLAMIVNFIQGFIDWITGASPDGTFMGAVARRGVDNFTGKADQLLTASVPDLDEGVRQYLVNEAEKKAEKVAFAESGPNDSPRTLDDVRIGELRPASSPSKPETSVAGGAKQSPSQDTSPIPDTSAAPPATASAKPAPKASKPSAPAAPASRPPAPKADAKKPDAPTVFSPSAPQKVALQPIVEGAVDHILAKHDVKPDKNDPAKNKDYLDTKNKATDIVKEVVDKNKDLVNAGKFDALAETIVATLVKDKEVGNRLIKAARESTFGFALKLKTDAELLETDPAKGKGKVVTTLEAEIKELFKSDPRLRTDLGAAVASAGTAKSSQGYEMVDMGKGYCPPPDGGFIPSGSAHGKQPNNNGKTSAIPS